MSLSPLYNFLKYAFFRSAIIFVRFRKYFNGKIDILFLIR